MRTSPYATPLIPHTHPQPPTPRRGRLTPLRGWATRLRARNPIRSTPNPVPNPPQPSDANPKKCSVSINSKPPNPTGDLTSKIPIPGQGGAIHSRCRFWGAECLRQFQVDPQETSNPDRSLFTDLFLSEGCCRIEKNASPGFYVLQVRGCVRSIEVILPQCTFSPEGHGRWTFHALP